MFVSGCRRRPSEKTAIQIRYVQPFSVATLKWGMEGATKVRSLSRAMAVFFEEPGMTTINLHYSLVGDMYPSVIFSKGAEPDTVEFLWNVAESLK